MKKVISLFFVLMLCMAAYAADAKHLFVKGRVMAEGKPLAGVVVSDGYRCTETDARGRYRLEADDDARFVFVSMPSGYTVALKDGTIPQFYLPIDRHSGRDYDFTLQRLPGAGDRFAFLAQADVQVVEDKDLTQGYTRDVADMRSLADKLGKDGRPVFSLDLGDIVSNAQWLYPQYIETVKPLAMPVYRAIGNHDMEMPPSRTYEGSMKTFESYFGPVNYSFNRGKAHFIVLDDCFCMGRDYQYIGYIPEQTFRWLAEDLDHVAKGSIVFVAMHIPCSYTDKLVYNLHDMEQVSNAAALWKALEGYRVHFISGHSHWNQNLQYSDSIMEHNTAAVCGIWWKADICMDGTPRGCGVYEVDGDSLTWYYHSFRQPRSYQMRAYGVGASADYPDDIIANVWNYDRRWKVEWLEDGKVMGQMEQYTGFDPEAEAICADKEKVVYDWISPVKTGHMFHARPRNAHARLAVRATDRFGHVYEQAVSSEGVVPRIKPITGTFLNLFYQDVRNKYMNPYTNATDQSRLWRAKVAEMKRMGINTLVLMAVANNDSAAYPSRLMAHAYPEGRESQVEAIMAVADSLGMQVYMSIGWAHDQDDDISRPDIRRRQMDIMHELAALYGGSPSFGGWYLPVEGCICPMFTDKEIKAVNSLADEARRATPGKKVLISPYGIYAADLDNPKFGTQLKKLKVDIVAYQDEIGCVREANPLVRLRQNWDKLVAYHRAAGIGVWANCEAFTWEKETNSRTSALIPADFPRLLDQMAMASAAGVDKIIAFSVCGIIDDPSSPYRLGQPLSASRTWQQYMDWKAGKGDYVELGNTFLEQAQKNMANASGKETLAKPACRVIDNDGRLCDGRFAGEQARDGAWVTFKPGHHAVTLEAASPRGIKTLLVRGLQDSGNRIGLPAMADLYGSNDGKTFTLIATASHQAANPRLDVYTDGISFNLEGLPAYKYLRIDFTAQDKCLIDEIVCTQR